MKKSLLLSLCTAFSLYATAPTEQNIAKISEAMGHLIGKNLEALGLELDVQAIVKGLQDAAAGKGSPMKEEECVQAIALLQEEHVEMLAEKNREAAEFFLETNQKTEGVISLENNKIQYKILKEGMGQALESYNSPIVRYSARYLDGQALETITEEELISLDETIPGFSKGIIGMKEGEIRTLYLHPDQSFGKQSHFPPDALMIFEVELIKADGSADAQALSDSESNLPRLWQQADAEEMSIQ
ncbi:MAG: FKBP-type peptidyl-prolyl cis-trans isomerase [Chlamydiales bacterium]|nr:FKBP-type peptidyl-prolyl cis-trans isomerase [Chlamydiales bacterium]